MIIPDSPTASSTATNGPSTVTGFIERGLAFYAAHGIEAKRLLSDNAFVYRRNRSLRSCSPSTRFEHRFIRPRRPETNGKVERFQQTLKREWGLGQTYRSSDHRAAALTHWLNYYNERRPHSSLGGRPPISRVHNVPRQDSLRLSRSSASISSRGILRSSSAI